MQLFSSPKHSLIVYVRRGAIDFYDKNGRVGQIDLPLSAVENLEVRDEKQLSELVRQFTIDRQLKDQRTLIVLDESVVFQKAHLVDESVRGMQEGLKEFEQMVPLEPEARATAMLVSDKQLFLFATNKQLCSIIAKVLEAENNKIVAATPAAVYGIGAVTSLDHEVVDKFLAENKFAQDVNFLA